MISLTPAQIDQIHIRLTLHCSAVEIRRWEPEGPSAGKTVEVIQWDRARIIETVKIGPSGGVTVLP